MKRAIITGATGAIGTALIQELIQRGVEVLVFCRRGSTRIAQIPKHRLVEIQECNLEELYMKKNASDKKYDVFFHFAWCGTTGQARNDVYMQNKNIQYALDSVKVAKEFGCESFIGAGSQAEYGRTEKKLTAATATFPETGYGMAKLCAGQMTRILAHQMGMRHIWMRVLSVYGPNDGNKSLVMSVINELKSGKIPKCTRAEQTWDYIYSADAANAFYLVAEKGIDGKTYVLGSGKERKLKNYIADIRDAIDPGQMIEFGAIPYAENQVMYLCADISELCEDVGFEVKTEFKNGILKIVN